MEAVTRLPQRSRDDTLTAQVAEEVRAMIARRRTTANKLSKVLGWSQSYMSRRVNGVAPFDVEDLGKLAAALNCEVTTFFPRPTSLAVGETTSQYARVSIASVTSIASARDRRRASLEVPQLDSTRSNEALATG